MLAPHLAVCARRADEEDPYRSGGGRQRNARALAYKSRIRESQIFPNSGWGGFVGGSYEFMHNGARLLDPYSSFFFVATGITPAMSIAMVGVGSQYAGNYIDSEGHSLDGSKTYRLP